MDGIAFAAERVREGENHGFICKYTVWFMPIGFECKNTNKQKKPDRK